MVNDPRFHCPMVLEVGACAELPERVAHHATRVLRLRTGDALTLFNGLGGEYPARVVAVERSRVSVEVLDWLAVERESPLSITLMQALQAGDKMDLTLQKAVELGVERIVPLISRRSVVRLDEQRAARRMAHWRGVVTAACEQCGRNRLPVLDPPADFGEGLATISDPDGTRLLLAPNARHSLFRLPVPEAGGRVDLLIGAEGGLTGEEMSLALTHGFLPLRFGPRILRTETAALAALATIQFLWGDLKEEVTDV